MANQLTEVEVLRKLGIPDFRHLSKDKVMSFASMLQDMDPEVAKKALEQFPEFAKVSLQAMTDYKETLNKTLEKDKDSSNRVYDAYDQIISTLRIAVEKEDVPFEEKQFYINKMVEVAQMADKKDSENKKFNWAVLGQAALAAVVLVGGTAAVLGGKTDIKLPKL